MGTQGFPSQPGCRQQHPLGQTLPVGKCVLPWPWRGQSGSPGPTGASQMAHRAPGGRPGLCTAHPCWGHERKGGEHPCSGPLGPRWPTLLMAAMHGGLWGGYADLTNTVPRPGPCGQGHCPTAPQGARSDRHMERGWGVPGGSRPRRCQWFVQLLPFFLLFHPTSKFFFFFLVVVVVLLLLKRNHIQSWFSADTGTRGGTRQTQTCDRQAAGGRPGSKH